MNKRLAVLSGLGLVCLIGAVLVTGRTGIDGRKVGYDGSDEGARSAATGEGVGDLWTSNYFAALPRARDEKKLVLVLFTAPHRCRPCRELEKRVLTRPDVIAFLEKGFLCVRLDADADMGVALRRKFGGGTGVPTVVVVDDRGRQRGQMSGFSPAYFTRQVENLANGKNPGYGASVFTVPSSQN